MGHRHDPDDEEGSPDRDDRGKDGGEARPGRLRADHDGLRRQARSRFQVPRRERGALADMNADLNSHDESKGALTIELMGKDKELMSLKNDCEFLLKYYDARKQAREDEKASLEKEIEILQETGF